MASKISAVWQIFCGMASRPRETGGQSAYAVGDARLLHVVRGDLDFDAVADDEADEALAHLAGDVGQEFMAVGHLHAEHGAGEHGGDHALQLDLALAVVILGLGFGCGLRGAVVVVSAGAAGVVGTALGAGPTVVLGSRHYG